MSLINKMLRDLDARHAPVLDRTSVPGDVHVHGLPPERPTPVLPLALLLVIAGGVAWYYFVGRIEPAPVPLQPPVAVVIPAVPVAPPAPPPVVHEVVAPLDPAPVIAPAPAKPPAPVAPVDAAKKKITPAVPLRLETQLPATKGKPAVAPPVAAAAPVAPTPPAPAVATPVKPTIPTKDLVPVPSGPTSIDKRPRTSQANDAAENEYRKALSALRRGAVNEAVEGFRSTLRLDAHHVSARQALLSQLVALQQWNEAQAVMEEGLTLDPEQTGWAMALARLQLENGRLPDAAETLAKHARYAEQNADYIAFQALLLQKQKRSREAAERYRAALALRPTESRWWYGMGLSLEADQKPQEARDAFLKAKETGNLPPELTGVVEQRLR